MTRIAGTPFHDDAALPGSKAERIQTLERELASQNQALGHANVKVNQLMDEISVLKGKLASMELRARDAEIRLESADRVNNELHRSLWDVTLVLDTVEGLPKKGGAAERIRALIAGKDFHIHGFMGMAKKWIKFSSYFHTEGCPYIGNPDGLNCCQGSDAALNGMRFWAERDKLNVALEALRKLTVSPTPPRSAKSKRKKR